MKRALKRGVLGFCLGVTGSIMISLIISLIFGYGTFRYPSEKLLMYINNGTIAAIVQVFISGIVGIIISLLIYFDIEYWSVWKQSIIHFTIMTMIMFVIFLSTSLSILVYIPMIVVLYFVIWNIQYIIYKYKVSKINENLKKINGEQDSNNNNVKFGKHLIMLLGTYSIIITTFIIYDFLEINLSIYIKYIILSIACVFMIIENLNVLMIRNNDGFISRTVSPMVSAILLIVVIISNYNGFIIMCKEFIVPSSNLSEVLVDGLTVGDSLTELNKHNYTPTDRYKNDYYNRIFEEAMIYEKNNEIEKIYGRIGEVDLNINGHKNVKDMPEVVDILGDDYIKAIFDDEQLLEQYIYIDRINNIKISFIYRKYHNGKLNYIIEDVIVSKV